MSLSFKEFVPGIGLLEIKPTATSTSVTPVDCNQISSTNLEDQSSSFSTKISVNTEFKSTTQNFVGTNMSPNISSTKSLTDSPISTVRLTPSAAEFIPSQQLFNLKSVSGMNTSANEWIPPDLSSKVEDSTRFLNKNDSKNYSDKNIGKNLKINNKVDEEELVEYNWNGSTFFIPESMAYGDQVDEETFVEPEENIGLEWTSGLSTIPAPTKRNLQTIGIPEPIRQHFQVLDLHSLKQLDPSDERYKEIPPRYTAAYMLDDASTHRGAGGSFGYPSSLYKVVDENDAQIYALKRFDNVRTTPLIIKNASSKWVDVRHPSMTSLYSITQEKGAVFFAYAYHPAAVTLKQRFIDNQSGSLSEALLWRILIQLLSGLRFIHSRTLALRVVSPLHIILTSGTRVRFSYAGVSEVLEFESRKSLAEQQVEDLVRLAYVILSLVSRSFVGPSVAESALEHLQQNYSKELLAVITSLLSGKQPVQMVLQQVSDHVMDEYDISLAASDALHSHLRSEYENSRLLRLLLKLGLINERPEYALSPEWSETGDRYVLKLFRDYLFHQTLSNGGPVIDMGHIISSLNKLDVGDPEKLLLSSRDNKDVLLVVSYEDVRRCIDSTFVDLTQQAESARRRLNELSSSTSHGELSSTSGGSNVDLSSGKLPDYHLRHSPQSQSTYYSGASSSGVGQGTSSVGGLGTMRGLSLPLHENSLNIPAAVGTATGTPSSTMFSDYNSRVNRMTASVADTSLSGIGSSGSGGRGYRDLMTSDLMMGSNDIYDPTSFFSVPDSQARSGHSQLSYVGRGTPGGGRAVARAPNMSLHIRGGAVGGGGRGVNSVVGNKIDRRTSRPPGNF